jgi:hypothetical protein
VSGCVPILLRGTHHCEIRNQKNIGNDIAGTLQGLSGWDWGQYGDVAFFVLCGYRQENGRTSTLRYVLFVLPQSYAQVLAASHVVQRRPLIFWPTTQTTKVFVQHSNSGQRQNFQQRSSLRRQMKQPLQQIWSRRSYWLMTGLLVSQISK